MDPEGGTTMTDVGNAPKARARNPSTPTRRPSMATTIGTSATITLGASGTTSSIEPPGTRMSTTTLC